MTPIQAARGLLTSLALPYGTVSILPWHENGHVVIHVMIEPTHLKRAKVPETFEGYEVTVEERQPAFSHG